MDAVSLQSLPGPVGDASPLEIVERKGLGHPDTICDALAEEVSMALCRHYLQQFGTVLHHNVDKVLLAAGSARPKFGGGTVEAPIGIWLAGRAVRQFGDATVPVHDIAVAAARAWLERNLRALDVRRHVEIRSLLRPGSEDLLDLFRRRQHVGAVLANDSSCGVGHAPRSALERMVLAAERRLNSPLVKDDCPWTGEDVKVMGVRRGRAVSLTVACAQIDRFVPDLHAYRDHLAAIAEHVIDAVREAAGDAAVDDPEISVNVGDDLERGQVYLTVTGTSAEAGDDGETGRGNRVGGLITPLRPMSLEAAAGKNPIHHTGKLYNVLARAIAEDVIVEVPVVAAAECALVSRIGRPLHEPQVVHVALATRGGEPAEAHRAVVEELVRRHLDRADGLWQHMLERCDPVYY